MYIYVDVFECVCPLVICFSSRSHDNHQEHKLEMINYGNESQSAVCDVQVGQNSREARRRPVFRGTVTRRQYYTNFLNHLNCIETPTINISGLYRYLVSSVVIREAKTAREARDVNER